MRARRSTFRTSCNTSLKFSTPAMVSASRGGRRSSTSMDTTLAARRASSLVSTPMPGPISSTPQLLSTPLASTILGGRPGLMMKFCPKPLESAKSYFSHRVRITERSVSSGIVVFLSVFRLSFGNVHAKASPFGSNSDDRRQRRKQGEAVGAAASRMRATAKQTLGATTRAVASLAMTERARPQKNGRCTAIGSGLCQSKTIIALPCSISASLPSQALTRQLSQRESLF